MDPISIPEEYVVSTDEVAPGISGLRIFFVNVFGVRHPNQSWTLIDAGIPYSAAYIRRWTEKTFEKPPVAIVLTHGHFDHVSAARELAEEWSVPILAHRDEFPYLTGQRQYPPPNAGAGGGLISLLSPLYSKGPVDLGDRIKPFPERLGAGSTALPEWTIVHTPGHTPGHVSFFRQSDRALIAGDAFCTTKPESFFDAAITQAAAMHGPPEYFTTDRNAAARSIQRLVEFEPRIVAPGHGKPISGAGVPEKLRELAAQFTDVVANRSCNDRSSHRDNDRSAA